MSVEWSVASVDIAVGRDADGVDYLISWCPARVTVESGEPFGSEFFPIFTGGSFLVSSDGVKLGVYETLEAAQASVS